MLGTSALVLFDLDLPEANDDAYHRTVCLFIDGSLQDRRTVLGSTRRLDGLRAPRGSLVRIELADDPLSPPRQVTFTAADATDEFNRDGLVVRMLGDAFSSCALP
jgi:hypothetical protein